MKSIIENSVDMSESTEGREKFSKAVYGKSR